MEDIMGLLDRLQNGKKCEVNEDYYEHFLNVLPPVAYSFTWNGEQWGFGFAEGHDFIYAFKKEGDRFFAQKTNLMNPYECGVLLQEQLRRLGQGTTEEKEAPRTSSWIPTWVKLGRKNPWIREADDPPFNTQSFYECKDDNELLDKLANRHWCLGQAFYRGDLCFINQVEGGSEWLTIMQGVPFESISFGFVMKEDGRAAGQAILDRIRAASVERCRELDY
jgi:hypothetical protein